MTTTDDEALDPGPSDELTRAVAAPQERRMGGFRRTLAEASNWRELRHTPYGLRPMLVLSSAGLVLSLTSYVLYLASVPIIQDLDLSIPTVISYLVLVGTLNTLVVLGVAYYADRRPRLPIFAAGMIVGGLFTGLVARARSGLGFGAPLVTSAVAVEFADTPTSSLLADYYPPQQRGKVFAIVGLYGAIGSILTPFLVGRMIDVIGWRATYVVLSVPVVLVGLYAALRLREPVRGYMERKAMGATDEVAEVEDEPPSFGEAWRTIWGIKTLRRVFIANIFSSAGSRIYGIAAIIFFIPREYGLSPGQIGTMFALAAVIALPGYFLAGGLVDFFLQRRPSQVLIIVGIFSLISAFGNLLLPFAPPLWLFTVFVGVISFGGALTGPALGVLYVNLVPAQVRTLGGAVRGLAELPGRILGVGILGVIVLNYGSTAAMFFSVPLFVIGALVFLSSASFFELDMRAAFASTLAREDWRKAQAGGQGKLLVCRGVDVEYDGVQVLFGIDFDVEEGDIIALLGTNGAGKSTLLRAISGTQAASSGAVVFDGRDITYMPPHETAARGVVHMPGGRGVFPGLTVRENLLLGSWMIDDATDVRERLEDVLEIFPVLADRIEQVAGSLSGGEQQQLSLAQAFLARPRLLMIDELSLGLSPAVVGELIEVVRRIHQRGVTIIVVEQSVNVALTLAEKAIFMEKGEIKFSGPTAELMRRSDILRAVYVKGTGGMVEASTPADVARRLGELDAARPVLEVDGVEKSFGGVRALDGVSLQLRESEVLGLIGPNGSGKTTLFDIISGFQRPDAGRIRFDGADVTDMPPDERARLHLVRRFQDARLFPSLTVYETLLVALDQRLEVHSTALNLAGFPQARRAERRARGRADQLVDLLDLGGYSDKFVKELSTGLRRIVDLACVLAAEPKVLLLDEPSSGIAQAEAESLGPLLRRVRHETGCSILIIEHDMPLISAVSDRLVALTRGSVLTSGTPTEVLDDDRVIEAYLGGSEAAIQRSGSIT